MTSMIFGLPGGAEWILLLLVALLIFGGSRLAGLGKGAGQAIREFKEETRDLRRGDEPDAVETRPVAVNATTADGRPVTTQVVPREVTEDLPRDPAPRDDAPRV